MKKTNLRHNYEPLKAITGIQEDIK